MALIGKIREKSALIVIVIGVALLAFILNDYDKIFGVQKDQFGYGTVYSNIVDAKLYEEAAAKFTEQDAQQAQQQQKPYGQKEQEQSNEKAWNYITETILFDKEFEALGLHVGEDEFSAYLMGENGFQVLPDIAQGFTDSLTGLFNPKLLQKRIEEMESSDKPEVQKQWEESKKYYSDRRKQEKYFTLINQGLYVTNLEAEQDYFAQKEMKNISFVVRRYSEIKDEDIKITDEELEKYYEDNKSNKKYFNRESSREVKYFDVAIAPSRKDTMDMKKNMNTLMKEFKTTTNDSLFVMKNSDRKFYASDKKATAVAESSDKAQKMMSYPTNLDTVFQKAAIGTYVGPYNYQGGYIISKVIGKTPSRLKARHILIGTNSSKDDKVIAAKQKTADSLLKLINKDNFAEYVTKFSDDPGSKSNGGEYDNFLEAEMVPEFSTFCATKPIGSIGVVKTDFGFHIIEVLERDEKMLPVLASVYKTFAPSIETLDAKESEVYNLLEKLNAKLANIEDVKKKSDMFDTIALKAGYFSRPMNIMENKPQMYGINSSFAEDKILKLAFNEDAVAGDLVSAPIKDEGRYLIAILSSIREKGEPSFMDVEKVLRRDLLEEKKAARLTKELKMDKSLESMAKRGKTQVLKGEITFSNPQMAGAGYEPEIVGALFSSLKDGSRTQPLKGKMGVYVVRIDKTIKAPTAANYTIEKQQMLQSLKSSAQGQVLGGLKKLADVVDNRRFLKSGIRR